MKPTYILSVDQGTTNTKALILGSGGSVVARASRPVSIEFPQPAWVEQDASALWTSVREAIDGCLQVVDPSSIGAVAVTNQRETVVVWDRHTGVPAGPCVVWQCRRTAPFCASIRERGLEDMVRRRTGLGIDPLFSASKARWLLDHVADGQRRASNGDLCIGTVDSWLLWNLTGGRVHATDTTNAARTQLLDLRQVKWDDDMLRLFDIPACALPEIQPSSFIHGETSAAGRLPGGIPIASLIGDSHAAMFSHGAFRPEVVKATYGTGSSLMMPTAQLCESGRALSSTIAWSTPESVQYALEGNITVTGGAVEWIGRFLNLPDPVKDAVAMAASVPDNGGVYVVPAFAGLGAPHWNDAARGLIAGLTRGTTAGHVARATLESIAYQVRDVFEAMREVSGLCPPSLLADGGASQNDSLMQFQADILGCPVVRNDSTDLSAIGAAWLAGLAIRLWADARDLEALPRREETFEPRLGSGERERLYAGWRDAVARTLLSRHPGVKDNSREHGSH